MIARSGSVLPQTRSSRNVAFDVSALSENDQLQLERQWLLLTFFFLPSAIVRFNVSADKGNGGSYNRRYLSPLADVRRPHRLRAAHKVQDDKRNNSRGAYIVHGFLNYVSAVDPCSPSGLPFITPYVSGPITKCQPAAWRLLWDWHKSLPLAWQDPCVVTLLYRCSPGASKRAVTYPVLWLERK